MEPHAVVVYWSLWQPEEGVPKCRTEHRVGLELLSRGLAGLHGVAAPPGELERSLVPGEFGKPALPRRPDVHFNISHCDGLAVCAFGAAPLGADVEPLGPCRDPVVRKLFTPEERDFFLSHPRDRDELFARFWTLKESFLKCAGTGLAQPLTEVAFSYPDYPDTGRILCSRPGHYLAQRTLPGPFLLSVCSTAPIDGLRLEPPMGGR